MLNTPPLVVAHRGASGQALENSFSAFALAEERGAQAIELDVHSTLDGGFVVHHDPEIPGLGPISGLGMDRVKTHTLSNGEPVPFLDEVIERVGLHLWVEVKALDPQWDNDLLGLLDRAGRESRQLNIHGFDHRVVARLSGEAGPGWPGRFGVLSSSYLLDPLAQFAGSGATVLWQERTLIDEALVRTLGESGIEVFAWTVNDRPTAQKLAMIGVGGICGNYPERLTNLR